MSHTSLHRAMPSPAHPARARTPVRRRPILLALLAASLPPGAVAQSGAPKPIPLDPVAVTAARTPQPIADLLADLTVIDADGGIL